MRFTSVIPRLITTMLAAAAAARGSAPASTSTTWTMPATTVHALSPMARRHEMSGRTAIAIVETPPAARNAPMRGRGAGRTTDDAIGARSGGQRVHGGRRVFGADPDVGDGQHRRVMRPHEKRMSDVGVRHLLVDGLAQQPLLGHAEGGLQRLERLEHVRKIPVPELE